MMRVRQAAWFGVWLAAVVASSETPARALCESLSATFLGNGQLTCGVDCWVVLPVDAGKEPTLEDLTVSSNGGRQAALRPVRVLPQTEQGGGVLYHAEELLVPGGWTISNGDALLVMARGATTRAQILEAREETGPLSCNDTDDPFTFHTPPRVSRNRPLVLWLLLELEPPLPSEEQRVAWDIWVVREDAPSIQLPASAAELADPAPLWERVYAPGTQSPMLLSGPSLPKVSGGERFRVCVRPHFPDGQTGELPCTVVEAQQADDGPGCSQAHAAHPTLAVLAWTLWKWRRRRFI